MSGGVYVYVDTTTTFVDLMMSKTRWMQLLSLSSRGDVQVAMSEVVLRETVRHRATKVFEANRALETAITKMRDRTASLEALGAFVDWGPIPDGEPVVSYRQEAVVEEERNRLEGLGVHIAPLPEVTHAEVLSRDLATRKPFQPSGKGYRDTLIWESIKPLLARNQESDMVFLVTKNTGDYCEKDGQLHSDLRAEIEHLEVKLHCVEDLDALMQQDALKPALASIAKSDEELHEHLVRALEFVAEAPNEDFEVDVDQLITATILSACDDLAGESAYTRFTEYEERSDGLDFSGLGFPEEITEPVIGGILPDPSTADWATYETYEGGTLLVRATVVAEVTLEGYIFKSDHHVTERSGVTIVTWDWNDHMSEVAATRQIRLVFQLRVESEAGLVQEVEFETAEPLE